MYEPRSIRRAMYDLGANGYECALIINVKTLVIKSPLGNLMRLVRNHSDMLTHGVLCQWPYHLLKLGLKCERFPSQTLNSLHN